MTNIAKAVIADALSIDLLQVTDDAGLATTAQWDSLAHFRLVLALEERLQRKLNPIEIVSLVDVAAVATLVAGT